LDADLEFIAAFAHMELGGAHRARRLRNWIGLRLRGSSRRR
jgi:hypothetical protein